MTAESKQKFYARIKNQMRHARISKDWSQEQIAKRLGISRANYEKYEGEGTRKVPADFIVNFCDLMSLDVGVFMAGPAQARKQRDAS